MPSSLVAPHGGRLLDLMATPERVAELKSQARDLPSWSLKPRQLADLELLMNGGFSPLAGFMGQADHEAVCRDLRLADGTFWPLPVVLDVDEESAQAAEKAGALALRDVEGTLLAVLRVEETWTPDREGETQSLCGTTDPAHPGVRRLVNETGPWYVGGPVEGVEAPHHYDFVEERATPAELRDRFDRWGWRRVAAFHTLEILHRAEQELTFAGARDLEAALLVQIGVARSDYYDVSHYSRIRCVEAVMENYPHTPPTSTCSPWPAATPGPGTCS